MNNLDDFLNQPEEKTIKPVNSIEVDGTQILKAAKDANLTMEEWMNKAIRFALDNMK